MNAKEIMERYHDITTEWGGGKERGKRRREAERGNREGRQAGLAGGPSAQCDRSSGRTGGGTAHRRKSHDVPELLLVLIN